MVESKQDKLTKGIKTMSFEFKDLGLGEIDSGVIITESVKQNLS